MRRQEANRPRTLIIGLDGATFDLLKPWTAGGHLPTLARLMTEGAHGVLDAWPNTNSATAWTSIVTGCNPGKHGVFDFGSAAPQRGQRWRPITASDRRMPAFWQLLSAADRRISVLNVPITYPVDPINGCMLGGMDSPGERSPGFSHPPGFYDELLRAGIPYALDVPRLAGQAERDPFHMPASVRTMVEGRARATLHLMQRAPWDVIMSVFVATDRMQHHYWPDEPLSDDHPGWAPLRELYRLLDGWLAEMLRLAGDDTTVLVISDHGFGPAAAGRMDLNPLLEHAGLAAQRRTKQSLKGRTLKQALALGRALLPPALQLRLAQALPGLRLQALDEQNYGKMDWARTQAFATLHDGRVFINLRGREPEGIVAPEDYEAARERAREVLLAAVDADTGARPIKAVHRREEILSGPCLHLGPDLFVEWDFSQRWQRLTYPPLGQQAINIARADRRRGARRWKGNHRREGIFIAWSPGGQVRRGAQIARITQYDIAPTVLHLQGLPVPADMDGRVVTEAFSEAWLAEHPIRQAVPAGGAPPQAAAELDDDEMGQVEARLRDLGYIE